MQNVQDCVNYTCVNCIPLNVTVKYPVFVRVKSMLQLNGINVQVNVQSQCLKFIYAAIDFTYQIKSFFSVSSVKVSFLF